MDKKTKRLYKLIFKQKPAKELLPLTSELRCRCQYEDEPDVIEYGFLPDRFSKYTDEELGDYFDDCWWIEINSPYDCTGRPFTKYIDFHRNPSGRISVRHYIGYDI